MFFIKVIALLFGYDDSYMSYECILLRKSVHVFHITYLLYKILRYFR